MYQQVPQDANNKKGGSCFGIGIGVCVGALVIIIWGVLPYVFATLGYKELMVKDPKKVWEYIFETPPLTPKTLPNNIWWPGCKKGSKSDEYLQECSKPCFSPDLIPAISEFNKKHPFKKVSYPSRKDTEGKTYTLTGWLLPGDKSNLPAGVKSPRVAINHGFSSNSNKWYPTLSAYFMRSMGFDVLLNNIRGFGYSENATASITTWGYAYHFDLLGAWDYLKEDPDNILGGQLPASKVGIMGFSMGAFITLNAFTLDKNVPAAWADSPPARPQSIFFFGVEKSKERPARLATPILKIPGVTPLTWFWMTNKAGVDVEARTPLKDIPTGPNGKRPVQLVSNLKDETVPGSDVKRIVKLITEYPEKYDMADPIYTDAKCNKDHHLVTMLLEPEKYRQRLCDFWTAALAAPKAICGLDKLPRFEIATSRRLAVEETLETMSVAV
jgi:pimeloyl-ACP methyl ester carboxylesterase